MAEIQDFISPKAEKQVQDLVRSMQAIARGYTKLFQSSKKADDQLRKLSKTTNETTASRKKLTELQKEDNRITQATLRTKAKVDKVATKANRLLVREVELLKSKSAALRTETKANLILLGPFSKLNAERALAAKRLKDLAVSGKANSDQLKRAQGEYDRLNTKVRKATSRLNENKRAANGLEGAYKRLNMRRNEAATKLKNLIASGKANTKQIGRAERKFQNLDNRLQKANNSVKQFGASTLKAGHAAHATGGFIKEVGRSLKMMVTMMAPMMAVFAIIGAIGDAFGRIREFDKTMVELSGVLGISRKDLGGLESDILRVASASTKTSNEVAELANTLATLGKTKKEIQDLLEPANNLSISLKATSEEAGRLLVGTLNAFGESSKEAGRYGDIIAKMRTSTALDFERIKDALSFLSPTARAAGVSIERTGAIIGVLVDNSIKGARSGRLMSSSFLRLASKGLTLEDALDKINKKQLETTDNLELLALANELFGLRAGALGLILANNRDKTDELTEAYERSRGTLDELTRVQLTALDAKIKILDSTWERFILKARTWSIFKDVIVAITADLKWMAGQADDTTSAIEKQRKAIKEEHIELSSMVRAIQNVNNNNELRERLIKRLNDAYPDFLRNVNDESTSNESLTTALINVTKEMENRYLHELKQSKLAPLYKQLAQLRMDEVDASIAVQKANKENTTGLSLQEKAVIDMDTAYETGNKTLQESANELNNHLLILATSKDLYSEITGKIDKINLAYDGLGKKSVDAGKVVLTEAEKLKNSFDLSSTVFDERKIDLSVPIAMANVELIKMREIANDVTQPFLDRIEANQRILETQIQIINFERELRDLNIQKLQLAYEINSSAQNELALERAKADAVTKSASEQRKLASLQKKVAGDILFLNKRIENSKKEILSKGVLDTRSAFLQEVTAKKEQVDRMLSLETKLSGDVAAMNKKARDAEKKANEGAIEETLANYDTSFLDVMNEKLTQFFGPEYAAIISGSLQDVAQVYRDFRSLRIQQLSDELNAVSLERQSELAKVEGDKNAEAQINAKYDKKEAVIRKKQLKAEQQATIFKIILSTAAGVATALQYGAAAPFLIAFALAVGLAQLAIVNAQKVPKFAKGDKGLKKNTYGEVGDAGRELLMFPSGEVGMAEKKTRLSMPKGTVIKSNRETEKILAANQMRAQRENDVIVRDYSELRMLSESIKEDRKAVLKAVKDRDQYVFSVSEKGVKALMKNSRGTTTYLDNRFR